MAANPPLYIVDSQPRRAERLAIVLSFINESYQVFNHQELLQQLNATSPAVVLLGALGDAEHAELLLRFPSCAFLLIGEPLTALLQYPNAVGLLTEPFSYNSLTQLLRDCQQYHRLLPGQRQSETTLKFDGMVGQTEPMQKVRFLIQQVAKTDANVLVLGQSGTGKEVVARNIHLLSNRAAGPFVPINCGAIPAELLESELFGHEKGAFTGAISTRKGRFELAQGGTLFLDEIGDMPQPMQVKLLRVLQERIFERVGGSQTIKADVRIIAATHRDLETMIIDGQFREDLFYRLNVFPIETPALRERSDDLPILIQELLNRQAAGHKGRIRFTERALQSLKLHNWPGNVRELANLLERMLIMYPDQVVDIAELPQKYCYLDVDSYQPEYPEALLERDMLNDLFAASADDSDDNSSDNAASTSHSNNSNGGIALSLPQLSDMAADGFDLKEYLAELEVQLISNALQHHDYVVARAAEVLGLRRTTLVEKMRKYNLGRDE
ncbi:MAG: sigma-54-dependent Fis family transcriptional regulator [Rheinheimera sp.]|mgnify:CR=1 FL=1|uniref:sigma-54 dependent transcriptional regulator n=1 Tax=Arsukibacterium sp. UBA3155 TaxID=1946058 RepID=UPI000C9570F4|nr:sigma-54 dependent transcriptional regulator [Arsukibacterium sp. UBA3155]MAD74947.1 sigma-54-dependent Fis family transcriptional regulator [Rheinheimera sp.]|tara:strand:- start:187864 stop:189354 length:1491 start_codon:yes stop_codon:yes gene_type:complete